MQTNDTDSDDLLSLSDRSVRDLSQNKARECKSCRTKSIQSINEASDASSFSACETLVACEMAPKQQIYYWSSSIKTGNLITTPNTPSTHRWTSFL
jgi:hypothetical protein